MTQPAENDVHRECGKPWADHDDDGVQMLCAENDVRLSWVPKGGECSEHGPYQIGPDCPECVREVLAWTS